VYRHLSQAFIRRESAALKNVDLEIDRYSLRCWDQPLVGDAGKAEQHRTHVVLGIGRMGLLLATLRTLHTHPAAR
jgi:colanic acid/amylovoran biosynthesis glycosyltransferase